MSFGYSADIMLIDGKKYIVIDVSENVHPIFCADFTITSEIPYDRQYTPSTVNRRGYNLLYRVENGQLYATKTCYYYNEPFSSAEQKLTLNGYFVIAKLRNDHWGWGNLFGGVIEYIDYTFPFELLFENGILKEMRDISSAPKEYDKLVESNRYALGYLRAHRKKIALKYLKGSYYEAPYYIRERSYPEGIEIRLLDDTYELYKKRAKTKDK